MPTLLKDTCAIGSIVDPRVESETPEQRECALQSDLIFRSFCKMSSAQTGQVKADEAHTLLCAFKDIQKRHPSWIPAMNRYLASGGVKSPDVHGWARQAWKIYCAWTAGKAPKYEAKPEHVEPESETTWQP